MNALLTLALLPALVQLPAQTTTAPTRVAAHVVVKVTGEVTFRRQTWSNFAPVRFGTLLRRGDVIRFEPNASVLVVCDGFSTALVVTGPGARPVPCAAERTISPLWNRTPVIPTAQIDVPSSLELAMVPASGASPARTWTSTYDQTPAFTWFSVPGADAYDLTVTGPGVAWTQRVYGADSRTAAEVPKLEPGRDYAVSVTPLRANRPLSKTAVMAVADVLSRRFEVLAPPAQADIDGVVEGVGKLGLPPEVATFLTAQAMARFGLFDSAIRSLLDIESRLQEPALKHELGDIYVARASYAEASTALGAAAEVYGRNGDVVGRALALEALANIESKSASGRDRSLAHFRAVLDIYTRLGDTENATRLKGIITVHALLSNDKR